MAEALLLLLIGFLLSGYYLAEAHLAIWDILLQTSGFHTCDTRGPILQASVQEMRAGQVYLSLRVRIKRGVCLVSP